MPYPNTQGSTINTSTVQGMTPVSFSLPIGYSDDDLPVHIFFGVATDDATIVAQVGADSNWGDGSLYVSAKNGAGKLFQKQNDVWVDLQA